MAAKGTQRGDTGSQTGASGDATMEQLTEAFKRDLKLNLREDPVLCRHVEEYQREQAKAIPNHKQLKRSARSILSRLVDLEQADTPRETYIEAQFFELTESPLVKFLVDYHGPQMEASSSQVQYDRTPRPDQREVLRRNFFETIFRGRAHIMLATAICVFEEMAVASWDTYRSNPSTELQAWSGRCLPIIQSSGMGKSRVMRELGQVTDLEGTPIRFTVFMLCLRQEEGPSIFYPRADMDVREYLNSVEPDINWRYLWRLKLHAWFEAFWITAKLFALDDAEEWQRICDSKMNPDVAARADFFRQVQKRSEPLYEQRKQDFSEENGDSSLQSVLLTQAACQNFMDSVCPDSWFVVAVDEASGLNPGQDAKFTTEALSAVRSLFSTPLATLNASGERMTPEDAGPDPARRCWCLFADTNAAINALVPPRDTNASERERNRVLERFPPFCPVTLNLELEDPRVARQLLFELSPIQSCAWPILARGGRPLWASLSENSGPWSVTQSPDLLRRTVGGDLARGAPNLLQSSTFVSLDLVLAKLLSPVKADGESGEIWKSFTQDQYMALLYQRLDLSFPPTREPDKHTALTWRAAQSTRVHHHLGVIRKLPRHSMELLVETAHEPVVVQAAAGFMRRNGAPYLAVPIPLIWTPSLQSLKDYMRTGVPLDAGNVGEADAQILCCMCHDRAARRPIPGVDSEKRNDAYRGYSAYVHLEDYLRQLVKWDIAELDDIPETYGDNAWVTAQCFRTAAGQRPITRQDLVKAFHERYGIVGRKNQSVWDLLIPIYCEDPNRRYSADAWSFIAVQVKARRDTQFVIQDPPTFGIGDLSWHADAAVSPDGDMVPAKPPIVVWINLLNSDKNTPVQVNKRSTTLAKLRSSSDTRHQPDYWEIAFKEFDYDNHPALAGLSHDVFPTLTHRVREGPILEKYVPEYKKLIDAAADGSHRYAFKE